MKPIFGTEMYGITFVFVVLEGLMFFYQCIYYLSRPEDRKRWYYLLLLFLLLVYNITGGLMPDPYIPIPIILQNIIAYGAGFAMGAYFPYYFYKAFDLQELRFHALYGIFLFLIGPFLLFFVVMYGLNGDLVFAIHYGIVIPFFYSIILLIAIVRAISRKYRSQPDRYHFWEMIAVYCAVLPWATLTPIVYYGVSQFWEALLTNGGLVIITILFIYQSIQKARQEYHLLTQLTLNGVHPDTFIHNCEAYGLTNREIELMQLIRQGLKYQTIGEKLFISELTVKKHVNNMFEKTGARNKLELINKLEAYSDSIKKVV